MVIETRVGVPIGVLDEKVQGLGTQIEGNSGAIKQLYTKFDRLEAKVDIGFDNLQTMMRELLQKQPVVEQPAMQPRQEEQTPNREGYAHETIESRTLESKLISHGLVCKWVRFLKMGKMDPFLGDFGDPIEERRVRNNARFMPPFQGHCDDLYEEPWLGRRQRRQQGQQAQFEPHFAAPPRHGMHFGEPIVESLCGLGNARPPPSFEGQCGLYGEEYWHEKRFPRQQQQFHTFGQQAQPQRHASQAREPRNAPWPQGDVVEPWYDHGGGRGNCGRARNYQGPQDRDPYGKNQDPLQRQQGRQAREPRAMELEFPRFKGGDPTSWMFKAIQYFEYYQVHDASKVMHASYHLDDDALIWFQSCEHDLVAQMPKVAAQIDPKVAECDPKVAAQIVPKVAAQIDPKVAECDPKVANGQVIRTLGECKEVKFKMQGLHLKLTFNLLELRGCGIVLGTQWLSTLGMINWDFKNLMMGFMHEGRQVWLQGLKEKPNLIQGSKDFKGKATMKGLLFQIMPCELASIQEEIGAPIRELVEEFPQGFSNLLAYPPRPWHSISMDFVEGLPTSSKQNVILVSVDRFTKYVHFILLSHPYTVSRVAFLFLQHMFKLHGLSSSIVSERDTAFTSLFWEELFRRQGVDLTMSSSYHPQFDEPTEVVNKSLEHYLRAIIADKPSLWVEWLPLAEYWFNSNYHTSTKLSPFEALYGYLPPRLIEFVLGLTRVAAVEDLLEHRQQVVGLLEHNLVAAQARMKQQVDKHRAEMEFEFGDWVFLRIQPFKQKSMRKKLGKLSPKFYEPYKVIQRVGMVAYKLELPEGACIHPVFHVSFLKAKLGKTITPISRLPPMDALGHLAPQPAKILETRTIKKRRLPTVTEVLVQWEWRRSG
uniref:Integrase catalytic domain-containing protein n=1 Tax=Fagus sylvatica TaxID=28930 RepID=A0A2N9ED64_FAGSY